MKSGLSFASRSFVLGLMLAFAVHFSACTKKGSGSKTEQSESDEPGDRGGSDEPGGGSSSGSSDEPGDGPGGSDEPGTSAGSGGHVGSMDVSGTYVGYVYIPKTNKKIPTEAYLFVIRGPDLTEFPVMNVVLKLQLGGFGVSEYLSQHYDQVLYSYEQKTLTLDEVDNNLLVFGKVEMVGDKMRLRGTVNARDSAVNGFIDLEWFGTDKFGGGTGGTSGGSDEPGGDGDGTDEPGGTSGGGDEPGGDGHTDHTLGLEALTTADGHDHGGAGSDGLVRLPEFPDFSAYTLQQKLMGQYSGACNGKPASLHVQTGRGLNEEKAVPGTLSAYRIFSQLAVKHDACNGAFCVVRTYENAGFDIFTGRLTLASEFANDVCDLQGERMICTVSLENSPVTCELSAVPSQEIPFKWYERKEKPEPSVDEKKPVPVVTPPVQQIVFDALEGNFSGYLHHERFDTYQRFELDVKPTIWSINPHNNDVVHISATASLYFGTGDDKFIQKFERTPFEINQGFALFSHETDGLLIIQSWTMGYIKGVWVSHEFGKIGTVELIKNRQYALSPEALVVGTPFNVSIGNVRSLPWELNLFSQPQASMELSSLMMVHGNFRDLGNQLFRKQVAMGAYDFYSGYLSLVSDEDDETLITGPINSHDQMLLKWSLPKEWGVLQDDNFIFEIFTSR